MELPKEPSIRIGTVIGDRYRVLETLGEGAMGVVYRVEHTLMKKELALKLLRREFSQDVGIRTRFTREAQSASSLDSENIVRVTDFGFTQDAGMYMVMELLEGRLLSELIKEAPQPVGRALLVFDQMLAGLQHAHARGVIHRDLKPENVIVVDRDGHETAKILDFGLAKITDVQTVDKRPVTLTGMVFGTPRYMSPEQVRAEVVDARSDLYSAAVILYELLTGRSPIEGDSAIELMNNHINSAPRPLVLASDMSFDVQRLATAVLKGLAKAPADRHPDAASFRDALSASAILNYGGEDAPTVFDIQRKSLVPRAPAEETFAEVVDPPFWRRPAVLLAVSLVLLLGGGLLWFGASRPGRLLDRAEEAERAGKPKLAEQILESGALHYPDHLEIQLALGHFRAQRDATLAVDPYLRAMKLDPLSMMDPVFQSNLKTLLNHKQPIADDLIEAMGASAPVQAAPLLEEIAKKARHWSQRRLAYEGLERLGVVERIDPLEYLSEHLTRATSNSCKIRRWYLDRLLAIADGNALTILRQELRKEQRLFGPSAGKSETCVEPELRAKIEALEGAE